MIIEKNKSIREKVYDTLKQFIIDGVINPGERIIETEYSKKFQISRTPIREAIRMLELEGLVETKSTGGVVVKVFTINDVLEIYKIRIALETIILEEVIKNVTTKDLEELDKILEITKKELEDFKSVKIFELFTLFNETLYRIADLPKVSDLIHKVNLYLKRFRKLSITDISRKISAYEDHVAILDAIKEKDINKAIIVNRGHLEASMKFILKSYSL